MFTGKDAGDDTEDSDADSSDGCTATTTLGASKREDMTLDAGLVAPNNKLGDFVWVDANRDGVQQDTETPVPGVTVKAGDRTTTTNEQGKYLFDNLPDGTYEVCLDLANLPASVKDYKVTAQNAGGDDAKDSDAGADGCTAETTLGVGKRVDLTLDMGLVSPPNKLGDLV